MSQSGRFRIVTDKVTRDPRLERTLIEYNRDYHAHIFILVGSILLLVAVMW